MTWAKIDDQFHNHPKLARLGSMMLPCVGLHVLALSWCAQYLTDGEIPAAQVQKLAGGLELFTSLSNASGNAVATFAVQLVEAGLWEDLGAGRFQIHDYLKYNPSREDVLAERKRTNDRVNKLRSTRSSSARGNGVGNASGNASGTPSPVPVPGTTFGSTKEDPLYSPKVQNLDLERDQEQEETAAELGAGAAEKQLDVVPDELRDAHEVLEFLNAKTGRTYGGLANLQLIDSRLREGWSVQDCRTMVMRKWRDWRDDPKMAPYARPSTLFNRGKLETYMAELGFRANTGR